MKYLIATLISLLLATQVVAGPLVYDEAIEGDVDGSFFILGVGANTIKGTITNAGSFDTSDSEFFGFILEPNTRLSSIHLKVSLQDVGSGQWIGGLVDFWTGAGPSLTDQLEFPSMDRTLFNTDIFQLNDFYNTFSIGGFGAEIGSSTYRVADYTLTMNVVSVPEPAPLALLGLGLAGLGISKRKSRYK